jgi:sRNA-binding regulator protein Hfq
MQAPRTNPGMGAPQQQGGVQTVPRQGPPQGMQGPPQRRGADGRPVRPPRPAPPPPKTISEGQIEELQRLGFRLEMDQAQLEERIGKPLATLTRIEAKDWIKRFRDQAEEASPTGKVVFGQWPGTREDQEAIYLTQQRDEQATLSFKLFSGEEFTGQIADFTPYTVTIKTQDGDVVLRKLAIVYYKRATESPAAPAPAKAAAKSTGRAKKEAPAAEAAPEVAATEGTENADLPKMDAMVAEPPVHDHALDVGLDSDRTGEPGSPERDNMDEDRGL